MKATETQGLWWIPESPDKKVYGTLKCSESGELRLSTFGTLADGFGLDSSIVPSIWGEGFSLENPQVTLSHAFVTRTSPSFTHSAGNQEFFANRGYFGSHLPTLGVKYKRATFSFSVLNEWARGYTGFVGHDGNWERPEAIEGQVPAGAFHLGIAYKSYSEKRERRFIEDVTIDFQSSRPLSEVQLHEQFLNPIRNFLTLAADRPTELTSLRATLESGDKVTIVGPAIFTEDPDTASPSYGKMLFALDDVRDDLATVVREWIVYSHDHAAALGVYFGSLNKPPGYTDLRFSLLAQVASLIRPSNTNTDVAPNAGDLVPLEERRLLTTHPVSSVRRAVTAMLADHAVEFQPLLDGRDAAYFVDVVANMVWRTLTRKPPEGLYVFGGSALYWLAERLDMLIKIELMKRMGLSTERIRVILGRNALYCHLRSSVPILPNSDSHNDD